MSKGYQPEIIEKDRILDLTKNSMRLKPKNTNEKPLEKRYQALAAKREPFLNRARVFSNYTIPNLYPLEGNGGDGTNTTGWQSFGSQAANTITNKLVMTLFPPHTSFAKLELTPEAKKLLSDEDQSIVENEKSLINVEKAALMEHERIAGRVGLGEALEHLTVGGTTCLYVPSEGNLINYPLDRFVCRRDKSGNLIELIIEEIKSIDMFEPAIQAIIRLNKANEGQYNKPDDEECKLYTRALFKQGFFQVTQEVVGEEIGESYRVTRENFPFIVLRWKTNYGEDYGRSLVEQYAGDFHVIQFLSEALAKGMILMADVKYLIRPGSVTDVDHLIESPTGEFIYGNIDDIGVLQLEKYADFSPIATVLEKYERRVGQAFMVSNTRDAERVTTYEIRRDAVQLEQSLGGAYTLLATTLQRPYFNQLLRRISFDVPAKLINTLITTGIEALSKLGDAEKLAQWTESMMGASQLPMGVQERIKWGEFAQHTANQLSLELPYFMSESEYAEMKAAQAKAAQEQQMMEAASKAAPQLLANQQG